MVFQSSLSPNLKSPKQILKNSFLRSKISSFKNRNLQKLKHIPKQPPY